MNSNPSSISSESVAPFPIWEINDGAAMPLETAVDWAKEHKPQIETIIDQQGGLIIRNLSCVTEADHFSKMVSCLNPDLRDYVGGTSPRSVVYGKIMNATNVPSGWSIILHQEMAYMSSMPERIYFFCQHPATNGGESTVGDMRAALGKIDPTLRNKFEKSGIQLRRTLPSMDNLKLKPGVQKSWSEVFATTDRVKVDHIVRDKGWRSEWIKEDNLLLWQDIVPATRTCPRTNIAAWCNQAHLFSPSCMMQWAKEDGRLDDYEAIKTAKNNNPHMLDNVFFADGSPIPDDEALHIYNVLRAIERPILLQRSDVLLLNNIAFSHGRKAYNGERKILVALSDRG